MRSWFVGDQLEHLGHVCCRQLTCIILTDISCGLVLDWLHAADKFETVAKEGLAFGAVCQEEDLSRNEPLMHGVEECLGVGRIGLARNDDLSGLG